MSKLSNKQVSERVAFIRDCLAKKMSQSDIGAKLGISQGAVAYFIARHVHKRYKPTTTAERLAIRKTVYGYGGIEPWQKADPNQFPDDIITEAVAKIGCSREHAAWVLSCPKDDNPVRRSAIGHRGGSAIG